MENTQVVTTGYIPRPIQHFLHVAIALFRFIVLVCHRRFGKCLVKGTLVPTRSGYKKVEDVSIGDFIINADGTYSKVLGTYFGGNNQIYTVEFANGEIVETDGGHLWYMEKSLQKMSATKRTPFKHGKLLTTEQLLDEKEYLFIPAVRTIGSAQNLSIDPYLFGYWLGNGNKGSMALTVQYGDEEETVLPFNPSAFADYEGGCRRYYFSKYSDKLRSLGVLNNKHIPKSYLIASEEQRIELLRGLMDSDGSAAKSGTCSFSNKNEVLVNDICGLISSLGLIPYKHAYKRGEEIEYAVLFTAKYFYPFRLRRKINRTRLNERPIRHKIVRVSKTEKKKEVYCFRVDHPLNLFLATTSYIPTHNTVFVLNEMIDRALHNPLKNPQYAYIAPNYTQAKRIAWNYLKEYTKNIPCRYVNESELKIEIERPHLQDKITFYLLGAENPDSLAGLYLDGVILDEYSLMNPAIWTTIIRPALADRKGWAIFIGTPRGQNHFYDVFNFAKKNPATWYAAIYKASDTNIIDKEEMEAMRLEMTDEEYQQELECSFTAALIGSYYGKYIEDLEKAKRITAVSYDLHIPVCTAWDLGIGDTTAIWFYQLCGTEVHIIDYHEMSGKGLEYYAKIIKEKPYIYDTHNLPHDAAARSLETGNSRMETLRKLGIGRLHLLPRLSIEDGIHASRMVLSRCFFDAEKCERGLSALKNYQKKWDGKNKIYIDKPLHDWSSNGADAFRYLALSIRPNRNTMSFSNLPQSSYEDYNVLE